MLLDAFVIPRTYSYNSSGSSVTSVFGASAAGSASQGSSQSKSLITGTSYSNDNISVSIDTIRQYGTTVYVADVTVSSAEYLKTAFANGSYGKNIKQTTSSMADDNNAILAVNGDYYGFRSTGFVLRNGVLYRDIPDEDSDALVIYTDGSFETVGQSDTSLSELSENGAWQVFSFGPTLIKNGEISVSATAEVDQSKTSNPRTALGIIGKLHYIFVVSDGRTSESSGLSLYELADIMSDYGCTAAYNLDGGGSSTMVFCGEIINNPIDGSKSGER